MKAFYQFSLLAMLLITVCSCKDDNEDPTPEQPIYSITIEEDNTHPIFSEEGGTVTVPFAATGNWTASLMNDRAEGWITISPTFGNAGNALLTITTTANETYDERNATIVLKCGNDTENIVVTQKQKDAILLSSTKYEIPSEGEEISVKVQANVSYEVETLVDWIKQIETRALTSSSLNFTIDANKTGESREGKIVIKSGELSETIHVYQSFDNFIVLTQKEYILPEEGGSIDVEIRSTVNYGVKILNDVDWITEVKTRAISTHTHHYQIAPNESYDARKAKIVFYSLENENLADTVSVYQAQKDAIVVAQSEYTVEAKGGTLTFSIASNVKYEVATSVDWISYANTRGLNEAKLSFTIAPNDSDEERKGVITLSNGTIEQNIEVIQNGISVFYVKQKEYIIPTEGKMIQVEVVATGEYNVQIPNVGWITEVTTKAALSHIHTFIIATNLGYDNRTAEIIFTDTGSNKKEVVQITQMQQNVLTILNLQEAYIVDADGSTLKISIEANVDFTVSASHNWIQPVGTRALTTKVLQFIIEPNDSEKERIGYINIDSDITNYQLNIQQKGTSRTDGDIEDMPVHPWE